MPLEDVFEYALRSHNVILRQSERANLAVFAAAADKLVSDNVSGEGLEGEARARWSLAFSVRTLVVGADHTTKKAPSGQPLTQALVTGPPTADDDAEVNARIVEFLSLHANPWLRIHCTQVASTDGGASNPGQNQREPVNPVLSYLSQIRIGRDLDGAQGDELSDRTFATLSGKDDHANDTSEWSFEGLALFPTLLDLAGNAELAPYVGYHRSVTSDTTDDDINDLTFGALLSFSFQGVNGSWAPQHHGFDGSLEWVTDDRFRSSVTRAELTYRPIWGGLYGNSRRIHGCLGAFCAWDVALVADFAEIEDAGDKTTLANMNQYARFGANLDVGYYVELSQGEIALTGNYRTRQSLNDNGGDAERFTASLGYTPGDDGHVSLSIDYVNGDDLTTLEREAYWALSLGFRN